MERVLVFPGVKGRRCVLLGLAHSRWSLIRPLLPPWGLVINRYSVSLFPESWELVLQGAHSSKRLLVSGWGTRVPQGLSLLLLCLSESIKGDW